VTVAVCLVACISNLHNVLNVDSPTIMSKIGKVNAILIASAFGAFVIAKFFC